MKKIFLLFLAGLTLFSCSKEEEFGTIDQAPEQPQYEALKAEGVKVVNGLLHFTSSESFQAFVDELSLADPRAVRDWKQQNNYVSLGDSYYSDRIYAQPILSPIDDDQPVVENEFFLNFNPVPTFTPSDVSNFDVADDTGVESFESGDQLPELQEALVIDPVLATVVNSNGQLGVGNFVVKVAQGHTVITPLPSPTPTPSPLPSPCNSPTSGPQPIEFEPCFDPAIMDDIAQAAIARAASSKIQFGDDFVEVMENVFVFKHYGTVTETPDAQNAFLGSLFGPNKTGTHQYQSSPRRRTKGRLYSQNYGIYAAIGCSTRNQRRRWRIWWRNNADNIYLEWKNVSYEFKDINNIPIIINEPPGSISRTNSGRISKVFAVQTGTFKIPLGGGKFDIKPAKSFKVKTFETIHRSSRGGRTGTVNLKY